MTCVCLPLRSHLSACEDRTDDASHHISCGQKVHAGFYPYTELSVTDSEVSESMQISESFYQFTEFMGLIVVM